MLMCLQIHKWPILAGLRRQRRIVRRQLARLLQSNWRSIQMFSPLRLGCFFDSSVSMNAEFFGSCWRQIHEREFRRLVLNGSRRRENAAKGSKRKTPQAGE